MKWWMLGPTMDPNPAPGGPVVVDPAAELRARELAHIGPLALTSTGGETGPQPKATQPQPAPKPAAGGKDQEIPRQRFDQVLGERNDLRRQLETLQSEFRTARQKADALEAINANPGARAALEQFYATGRAGPAPGDNLDDLDGTAAIEARINRAMSMVQADLNQRIQSLQEQTARVLNPIVEQTTQQLRRDLKAAFPEYDPEKHDDALGRYIGRGLTPVQAMHLVALDEGIDLSKAVRSQGRRSKPEPEEPNDAVPPGAPPNVGGSGLNDLFRRATQTGSDADWQRWLAEHNKASGIAKEFFEKT